MDSVHEEEYKGLKIKIYPDENAQGPEDNGDDALFLVAYHSDFSVDGPRVFHKLPAGVKRDPADKGRLLVSKSEAIAIANNGADLDASEDLTLQTVKEMRKKYHVFGLEAYIHSGVVLALSHEGNFCDRQWDVSQLGLVFVSKKEWRAAKKARAAALSLINEWNDYLSGNVYGYVIETPDGEHLDSCWGFSGDYEEYCLPEARSAADYSAKKYHAQQKQLKSLAVQAVA